MSDLICLDHGRDPWCPTPGSHLFRTFDEYDVPLAGVVIQDNCLFLFECLVGRVGPISVWIYNYIGADDLAKLDDAEGDDFERVVAALHTRPSTLAVATEDEGIVASVAVANQQELAGALEELKAEVRHSIDRLVRSRESFDQLQATCAVQRLVEAAG